MSTTTTWDRPISAQEEGEAFLFFVVFGPVDRAAPLSRSVYRTEKIPETLEIMKYGPDCHPEVLDSFRSGYLWDEVQRKDPELAERIAAQEVCTVIKGSFEDPDSLDYLRDTIGLITYLLDRGGVAV
ncbi:MAG: hypothetical protein IPL39_04215 [Opitutaceae bacterium]|nr:hypothetical protein [Opitutaceae bacterium]